MLRWSQRCNSNKFSICRKLEITRLNWISIIREDIRDHSECQLNISNRKFISCFPLYLSTVTVIPLFRWSLRPNLILIYIIDSNKLCASNGSLISRMSMYCCISTGISFTYLMFLSKGQIFPLMLWYIYWPTRSWKYYYTVKLFIPIFLIPIIGLYR